MPGLVEFYVVPAERVADVAQGVSASDVGARWAQIEAKVSAVSEACEGIDALCDAPIIRGHFGMWSVDETAALHDHLASLPPDLLARVESDPLRDRVFWALRETSGEARSRGGALVIECHG